MVDDDAIVLEILNGLAARAGYSDVTTALSAAAALECITAAQQQFHASFSTPVAGVDGVEFCDLLRRLPDCAESSIIMVTAMIDRKYMDQAYAAVATDYVTKPFDVDGLTSSLGLAEEVVVARQEAAVAISKMVTHRPETEYQHAVDLSDEVQIEGVEYLIEYAALGNYLIQLSRAGLIGSQVLAVKIDRIEAIYARASAEEFLYALTEVADAIGDVLRTSGFMMAYAGNGAFVVVSNKATLEPSVGLEAEIQDLLDEKNSEYDNGDPLDIEVSIGNPVRPNTSKTQCIRKTFDRAIARAENRVLKKRSEPRPMSIRLVGG